ncbi:MAG TPA: hypothetical protein VF198_10040 [Vicinamibacterales bacterium]
MNRDCRHRASAGLDACPPECPAATVFGTARVDAATPEAPPADPSTIDIAVLDMHHGWPNLGHGAIVHAIEDVACDMAPVLREAGLRIRVISYDVRRGAHIPEPPGPRHRLYVGTGGPGHLDPRLNDGHAGGAQGIREDPSWERPLFALFDAIARDEDAVLLGVCHTFGVMCRWLGVADAVLRGPDKGGKSAGVVDNELTDAAASHPWFGRFVSELPDGRRFAILDSRLYDLRPRNGCGSVLPLSFEPDTVHGPRALTGIEVARTRDGAMPRVLGVNHHPEIVNPARQLAQLRRRLELGDVSAEWYAERAATLTETIGARGEQLERTSSYMFLGPLRHHLALAVRERR